jgi:hypothetical protein
MRPSRMTILALAGLCALHVFMLAGHGRGNDVPMRMQAAPGYGGTWTPSLLAPPMPADADGAGIDMTIACLAVLAGLLLLLPGRKGQAATVGLKRPATIGHPPSPARAGPRTRSLAELCISLT